MLWKDARCTRQYALIADRNAKFPSSPIRTGQSTAESALPREDPKDQASAAEDPMDQIGHVEDTR